MAAVAVLGTPVLRLVRKAALALLLMIVSTLSVIPVERKLD